jgi:hypothetical protein
MSVNCKWQKFMSISLSACTVIAVFANSFSSVQFSSAQLSSVQFSSVQLSSAHFSSVQFSSAQLSSAQLSSVQLSSAQLSSAQLSSAQFSSVQFSSVQLSSVQPSSVKFSSVRFSSGTGIPLHLSAFIRRSVGTAADFNWSSRVRRVSDGKRCCSACHGDCRGELEVYVHSYVTLPVESVEWWASSYGSFAPGKNLLVRIEVGGWFGPIDGFGQEKRFWPLSGVEPCLDHS